MRRKIKDRMTDAENIQSLKNYLRKLIKIINYEADFNLFSYKLIKKEKIDDILCCILSMLPDSYKKLMKIKNGKKLSSIIAYNLLFNSIKQKFILNPNVYMVSHKAAINYINAMLRDVERDIEYAEKHAV